MEPNDHIKARIAKGLLSQFDPKKRKRLALIYVGTLLVLFLMHGYFSSMATPLRLMPQTMSAIGMGYVMLCVLSLRRFGYVADFIDWSKVKGSAGQVGPSSGG
jgi:hypothetical protein